MAQIFYKEMDDFLRKEDKYRLLNRYINVYKADWKELTPDKNNNWLTEGLDNDFEQFISIDGKKKIGVFDTFSLGPVSNNDSFIFNSSRLIVFEKYKTMVQDFSEHNIKWQMNKTPKDVESILNVDEKKLKWIRYTKKSLARGKQASFVENNIRISLYRPFFQQYYNMDRIFNEEVYQFPKIFPNEVSEKENKVICVSGIGSSKPFHNLMVSYIPCLDMLEKTQCFPFYTYNEDGTGRRENISDWALEQFRTHYKDKKITKWDIFHYIYAVLHKPDYRVKYAANLKKSLPRIPYYEDFGKHAKAGKRLAELHLGYEDQKEYYLQKIEAPGKQLDWRVSKMKLSKDRQSLVYNDFLTLSGIPPETFEYKLGNRSALDWIIDQYQVSTDKRSGISNDPNRPDDPEYIFRLIGKIITVSLETVKVVRGL